jgi:hypothetical protein
VLLIVAVVAILGGVSTLVYGTHMLENGLDDVCLVADRMLP